MRRLLAQFTRFGIVGAVGLVIDLGVFNLLIATVLSADRVHEGPVIAKIISTTLAIVSNWIGNRHWTFREHRGPRLGREGVQFGLVSLGGLLIGVGCLWVSRYLLGFESTLADNISSNVVGLALGTAFRFWLYRVWVFAPRKIAEEDAAVEAAEAADAADAELEAAGSAGLGATGSAVAPARTAPQRRIQAVASVDDGALGDQ